MATDDCTVNKQTHGSYSHELWFLNDTRPDSIRVVVEAELISNAVAELVNRSKKQARQQPHSIFRQTELRVTSPKVTYG